MVTDEQFKQLYPKAKPEILAAVSSQSEAVFARFELEDNPDRLYFFLAQIGHESGGLSKMEEGLNYTAKRLTEVWPKRFPTLDAAAPYAGNPQALANKVYANRLGNGDEASGDGWRFRGRGLIQITGRDNYRAVGAAMGRDLTETPDDAATPEHVLETACGYWKWRSLNALCDAGDFDAVSRRINGGEEGLGARRVWLDKVRSVLNASAANA